MTKPDIDYHESAIETLTEAVNKMEIEAWKFRKDMDDASIWLKELDDWADWMHEEVEKHKKSDRYFQSSLKDTHKQYYEKFESLFLKIKQLFGERKTDASKYISYNK